MRLDTPLTATAAGICLIAAIGNLAPTQGSLPRISSSKLGWHRNPSFLSTKSSASFWSGTLLQTRGGSSEDVSTASIATEIESTADTDANTAEITTSEQEEPLNLTFSATNPEDGSETDPDGLPARFLQMKKNNREEAKEAFEAHLQWREEFEVNTILARPHPKYDLCKAMVPHYFAGRDPHNNIIFVQRPSMLDFEMMKRNNATIDDLLDHYIYIIEYCWNILDPGPPDRIMTNVLDMRGTTFRNMKNQEYIGFGKRFVSMMSSNYPGRSYKTLVVNAPTWFHALYKIFKPMLRESTRQKIVILKSGSQQEAALKFYLGDNLPKDLISGDLGKKKDSAERDVSERYFMPVEEEELCEPGPNSVDEFKMRQFCINQLKLHNVTMQDVI